MNRPMDDLARSEPADRAAVFAAAASEQGLPVHIVEKDFWACWMLKRLFNPPLVKGMVFKGGTSLSKGWDAIKRFSEDLDLTLPRVQIPEMASIDPLDQALSKTKRRKRRDALQEALKVWCSVAGAGELRARVITALGTSTGWTIETGGVEGDTMWFHYPKSAVEYTQYVESSLRLEFGVKMPVTPALARTIRPYCDVAGEYRMTTSTCTVQMLAPERTFWEKATLVHARNSGAPEKPLERVSRHYADLASMWEGEIGPKAIAGIGLLRIVAAEKDLLYPSMTSDYSAAGAGRLRLVPGPSHEAALRRDYAAMREMYFGDPMTFDKVLKSLGEIEERVRTLTAIDDSRA